MAVNLVSVNLSGSWSRGFRGSGSMDFNESHDRRFTNLDSLDP